MSEAVKKQARAVLDALWDTVDPVELDTDTYAVLRELAPSEVAAWVNGDGGARPIVDRLRALAGDVRLDALRREKEALDRCERLKAEIASLKESIDSLCDEVDY